MKQFENNNVFQTPDLSRFELTVDGGIASSTTA